MNATPTPQSSPEASTVIGEAVKPTLVVATENQHKAREIGQILAESIPGLDVSTLAAMSIFGVSAPREDGITFAENALIKARHCAEATGLPAIADDSGLTVDVLGGAPGIFSARWAGKHGDDVANRRLLLAQLADIPREHRKAQFVCAVGVVIPGENGELTEHVFEGICPGVLDFAERGENGFGYDPIFVPDGFAKTSAEMSESEKNRISHRGKAIRLATPLLQNILKERSRHARPSDQPGQ